MKFGVHFSNLLEIEHAKFYSVVQI